MLPQVPESLTGSIKRITFPSQDSGFCVLRVQVKGKRELVTVIGSATTLTADELIECQGYLR